MTPAPAALELPVQDALHRQLEVTVLTQVRDSLALINANLSKLDDKVESLNAQVIGLAASRYDEQIAKLERSLELQRAESFERMNKQEAQLRANEVQIARQGLGMAIAASIGTMALGGLLVQLLTMIFGAK